MAATSIDAFILYNEQETVVEGIVDELSSHNISTHFWRRDIPVGDDWKKIEDERLKSARAVVVFLGDSGWGPNHLRLAREARALQKRMLPVLVGSPPDSAFVEVDGLFRDRRYLDLRKADSASLARLEQEIRRTGPNLGEQFDRVINILVDGSEEQRLNTLVEVPKLEII